MRKYIDAFTVKRYTGIFIILAVVTVFSLMVNVTIAYLGDKKDKTNTVKVGYGEVSIDEQFSEPSELEIINTITKQVQIQNTGTVPAFVRVYAEFADSSIASQAKVKYGTGENDVCSWAEFKEKLKYNKATFEEPFEDLKWRYVPLDDASGLGGYFYYTEALNPYEEAWTDNTQTPAVVHNAQPSVPTTPLFYGVTIDYQKYDSNNDVIDNSNIDRIQPVEMIIYSELVQTVDTGRSKVTTKTVDEYGNTVNEVADVESSVYGYDFNKTPLENTSGNKDNWQDAWKRFLKKDTPREQSEVSKQQTT